MVLTADAEAVGRDLASRESSRCSFRPSAPAFDDTSESMRAGREGGLRSGLSGSYRADAAIAVIAAGTGAIGSAGHRVMSTATSLGRRHSLAVSTTFRMEPFNRR